MTKSNVVQMPNTKSFQLGELNLQLRLDGKSILAIEKRLDEGIMGLFVKKQGEIKLPPANSLLIILQGANKTSGVTDKAIVDAFELLNNILNQAKQPWIYLVKSMTSWTKRVFSERKKRGTKRQMGNLWIKRTAKTVFYKKLQ